MTEQQQHPITPPPQLRQLWAQQAQRMDPHDPVAWQEHLAIKAAHWGAYQELEACCEWLREARNHGLGYDMGRILADKLRAARRPKPPSLAEQALEALEAEDDAWPVRSLEKGRRFDTIRAALERLQELEGKQ